MTVTWRYITRCINKANTNLYYNGSVFARNDLSNDFDDD